MNYVETRLKVRDDKIQISRKSCISLGILFCQQNVQTNIPAIKLINHSLAMLN